MPPPIARRIMATAKTAMLMTSPVVPKKVCLLLTATEHNIIPRTESGSVVNQLSHPRNGISPTSRKMPEIMLTINPINPMKIASLSPDIIEHPAKGVTRGTIC